MFLSGGQTGARIANKLESLTMYSTFNAAKAFFEQVKLPQAIVQEIFHYFLILSASKSVGESIFVDFEGSRTSGVN